MQNIVKTGLPAEAVLELLCTFIVVETLNPSACKLVMMAVLF